MVRNAKDSMKRKATSSEIYAELQAIFVEIDKSPVVRIALLLLVVSSTTTKYEKQFTYHFHHFI